MKSSAVLLGLILMSLSANGQRSSVSGGFSWQDSSQFSRIIVNATQGIEALPRERLARDRIITDYAVTNATEIGWARATSQYEATYKLLTSYGLVVGTYVSGTTVRPESEENHWPWSIVPKEWMPKDARYYGNWPSTPSREVIDVTEAATRHWFQLGVRRLWEQSPAPLRFVDNAAIHSSAGRGQSWSGYCANIQEIRELGESMGTRVIFNVAVHVGEMADEEANELIRAVGGGGILLEMPWSDGIRKNPAATERARLRYRQLLDHGAAIIMAPPGEAPSLQLVQWVNTWRKPSDRLYFGGAFYKPADMQIFGPNPNSSEVKK